MLDAMRILALDYVHHKSKESEMTEDLEEWFYNKKTHDPTEIFPFLIESSEQVGQIYVLSQEGSELAGLQIEEMRTGLQKALPFIKPTGSQSAQIGPVFKRSYIKAKGAGPSAKIINTTMKYFHQVAESSKPWSTYFAEILSILDLPNLKLPDGAIYDWRTEGFDSMIEAAVQKIGPLTDTVLLTVRNQAGFLPGEVPEYTKYLMNDVLAGGRYLTGKVKPVHETACPLCGRPDQTLFPNALKGAGFNLTNMDRISRFPGMDIDQAWKGYALCQDCADLLYVYKYHVLEKVGPKKDRRPFSAPVAGKNALIIPYCMGGTAARREIFENVNDFILQATSDVEEAEESLLDVLKDEESILNINILWADIGQLIENISGIITDVPPSRLKFLSAFNENARNWRHPVFPGRFLKTPDVDLSPDLALKAFGAARGALFWRPGGRKTQHLNQSHRLFDLRRQLAASVYHGRALDHRTSKRLWDEIQNAASWWWLDAIENRGTESGGLFGLLNEGRGKKGDFPTLAGWIRHWAWWIYYLKQAGVLKMENSFYKPKWEGLNSFMGPETGIDTEEKAFAFLLGVLFGRLVFLQSEQKVRISALNWTKRFSIDGRELPALYRKVRAKLLEYQNIPDPKVKRFFTERLFKSIEEISLIGARLGDDIRLSSNQACYFLLLGQALSNKILKKENSDG